MRLTHCQGLSKKADSGQYFDCQGTMKPDYPYLATRLFNTPLAIAPGKIEIVMAAFADRFELARIFRANGKLLAFDDDLDAGEPAPDRAYQVVEGGICRSNASRIICDDNTIDRTLDDDSESSCGTGA